MGIGKEKVQAWENKPLHGQLYKILDSEETYKEASTTWLATLPLKAETESLMIAYDQAVNTNYYLKKNILKQPSGRKCRRCGMVYECILHIVAGCTMLTPIRHNKVAS